MSQDIENTDDKICRRNRSAAERKSVFEISNQILHLIKYPCPFFVRIIVLIAKSPVSYFAICKSSSSQCAIGNIFIGIPKFHHQFISADNIWSVIQKNKEEDSFSDLVSSIVAPWKRRGERVPASNPKFRRLNGYL